MRKRRVKKIATLLDKKKAEDVAIFDLKESDYFVDYVVIATSLAGKHGHSLLDMLKQELKPLGEEFLHVEESDDWIVADLGDIIIHIMSENVRLRFQLEEFLTRIESERQQQIPPSS